MDDGSEDDSYALLCELKSRFTRLRVVRHARAVGPHGGAERVRQGAATGWWCWTATARNDPADIPAMLEEAKRRFAADKSQVRAHRPPCHSPG